MCFFKALKLSGKTFRWDENYTKVWNDLKDYLTKLQFLCAPAPGETLYLYLLASDQVVASTLIKESGAKQQPVYFVSKVTTKPRHDILTSKS